MYKENEVSLIIATYNRAKDLEITLREGIPFLNYVKETLVVDQSTDGLTGKLIKSLKNKKIKYYYRKIPSLTMARNFGAKKVSKSSKIVIFLDDDVTLEKDYLKGILDVFNKYPETLGVSGFQKNKGRKGLDFIMRKIFLLENSGKNYAGVKSAYGAAYPSALNRIIRSQWLNGYNMAYKKEIFKEFYFDERLSRYALAEDFDFSYRVGKKYPGSLFLTPYAIVIHRFSPVERAPAEKASYMNQVNHFYLNFKNFDSNVKEKITFAWNLLGIGILRTLQLAITGKKNNFLKLKFYLFSVAYCLKNLDDIKKGRLDKLMKRFS